eukprot:68191-Pelagomonas_calceolata.AAC.1
MQRLRGLLMALVDLCPGSLDASCEATTLMFHVHKTRQKLHKTKPSQGLVRFKHLKSWGIEVLCIRLAVGSYTQAACTSENLADDDTSTLNFNGYTSMHLQLADVLVLSSKP